MANADKKELKYRKRLQQDMLGVDLSASTVKAIRLRNQKSGIQLVDARILPLAADADPEAPFEFPKSLAAHHAAVALTGKDSIIRLLTLPGSMSSTKLSQAQLREQVGVNEEFRLAYSEIPSETRGERRLLTVAIRNSAAKAVAARFGEGIPAPVSLEVAGLASLTAFMSGKEVEDNDDAFGFIESGAEVNLVAFFCRRQLVLLRKFDFGGSALIDKVQRHLGLERDVAMGLVTEGSFDLSEPVKDVVGPFFRQLSISKDFVERHQRTRLTRIYVTGGMSMSTYWIREISQELGVKASVWNPFERLNLGDKAPAEAVKQGPRFTAAIGAALGAMTDS